jgi:hypothetical protein
VSYKPFCDLCDKPIDGEPNERGIMCKHEYCGKCVSKVDRFIDERNALHDKMVADWNDGLVAIRSVLKVADDAKLPD